MSGRRIRCCRCGCLVRGALACEACTVERLIGRPPGAFVPYGCSVYDLRVLDLSRGPAANASSSVWP